ncbi:hypothetical protein HZF24_01615 [Sedimentibacter hydroxybenzoicus DSM 7310]|uniref:Uncharacterized protein n=1 Tax=Sedimentibacter hydroxybenzoicus DSM 7310 TaxID=1123245 RepID=A0A974GUZ1_SEDHY|nr:hypothetical protein [Sedimentibacter hydroxybenzoicus]NYB72833.1 hypothetical protein [Sedimentibacter hydroxybenzoicus DSM 7310]
MTNKDNFVAYEYKNITVGRNYAALYTDCLSNFGWMLIEEYEYGYRPVLTNGNTINKNLNLHIHSIQTPPDKVDGPDMVTLKFKRDRHINNKLEIDRLERKCEEALSAIGNIERRNSAHTMGTSLGAGIIGAVFIGLAIYSFISSNIAIGVFLTIIGLVGWGIGFFSYHKIGQKKSIQTEPIIQEQFDIAYSACEQAHTLLV